MKKVLSFAIAIIMIIGTFSALSLVTFADTAETLKVYIADSGLNTNSGLDANSPVKDFTQAVKVIKANIGEATAAEIVLVGDVTTTTNKGTVQIPTHSGIALTITSNDKTNARLLIGGHFRLGGETLFTNITILRSTNDESKVIFTNGFKLTMGKAGVANDVISGGTETNKPISISASNAGGGCKNGVDVTINSGTYYYLNTAAGMHGETITGNVNFVINNANMVSGYIGLIGGFGPEGGELLAVNSALKAGSNIQDYNVTINGGTFVNTKIVVGVGRAKDAWTKESENKINGQTVIDINGGTFTNSEIVMGETINERDSLTTSLIKYNFVNGVIVDLSDIPNANKATYKAVINANDIVATPTLNKITVVEHTLDNFVKKDDDKHTASCDCGCGKIEEQNHTYGEPETTKQPTHSTAGEKKYTCADCKGVKVETISPDTTTHNYTTGWVKADDTNHQKTCDDPACPDANKGLVTEAHAWDEGEVTKEATHLEEGEKIFKCATCNGTKTEVVAKTSVHSMGDWEKHDANQHKRVCECGEAKYADHDWGTEKVTKEATAEAEGEKTFTCSTCGETKVEAIAKLAPVDEGGCGSTVGIGMAAVVVACAAAFVGKKKED